MHTYSIIILLAFLRLPKIKFLLKCKIIPPPQDNGQKLFQKNIIKNGASKTGHSWLAGLVTVTGESYISLIDVKINPILLTPATTMSYMSKIMNVWKNLFSEYSSRLSAHYWEAISLPTRTGGGQRTLWHVSSTFSSNVSKHLPTSDFFSSTSVLPLIPSNANWWWSDLHSPSTPNPLEP